MAGIATSQVSVGTSATLIVPKRTGRESVRLLGTAQFYIGDPSVTLQTGFRVEVNPSGEDMAGLAAIELDTSASIYGVVFSGSAVVMVLEIF